MSSMESRELERLRYRQGQTLRGVDFRDQRRIDGELMAWHNRALHNVYGVVKEMLGAFRVTLVPGGVLVSNGLAYDCFGRDLLLASETEVPYGDQKAPMFLVIRRRKSPARNREGSCQPFGLRTSASNAELIWIPQTGFSFREGVPIARTAILNNAPDVNFNFVAPVARALSRPKITSRTTIPGATNWELLPQRNPDVPLFEVRVKIDTSSAGFTSVPEYFATLQGTLTRVNGANPVFSLHFDHVEEPGINGFVFSFFILVIKLGFEIETQIRKFLNEQNAYISWLGIQRNPSIRLQP